MKQDILSSGCGGCGCSANAATAATSPAATGPTFTTATRVVPAAAAAASAPAAAAAAATLDNAEQRLASVNDIALHAPGARPSPDALRELAYAELLRQEAVRAGLLPDTGNRELDDAQRQLVESMVDQAVTTPSPGSEECLRYYEANKARFVNGQAMHVRHILFAVTPGVNVQALSQRAEKALSDLSHKGVAATRFAALAAELSNCPSGAEGGDLGWLSVDDLAPELATALFQANGVALGLGLHPRLVHSRFGFHIIEVLDKREGKQAPFEQVEDRVGAHLALHSRSRALHQYMRLLVGQASITGVELEGADSPLVQ
jgi:peptidyl-prolyl cis-trans isomerase C